MEQQFKDWIQVTASCLRSGYSVENAFLKAGDELKLLYGNKTDIQRSRWYIDKNIPIFKGEGREYIEQFVNVGEF